MNRLIILAIGIILIYQQSYSQTSIGFSSGIDISKLLHKDAYDWEFESNQKTGYCIGASVSKQLGNWLSLDGELLYDHKVSYSEYFSGGLGIQYYQKGNNYIDSYNIAFYPSFSIPFTRLFINTGIYIGYLNCRMDGTESLNSPFYGISGFYDRPLKKNLFDGTDLGFNTGLMYKKDIFMKFKIFARADYRISFKYYSNYRLSYDGWLFRLGFLMKISKK